jgi:hypothetical protein
MLQSFALTVAASLCAALMRGEYRDRFIAEGGKA